MSRNISKENVITIIKEAFKPLECYAELEDRQNRVGFRVFDDENKTLYNSPSISIKEAQSITRLNTILLKIRYSIESQGVILEPWKSPI